MMFLFTTLGHLQYMVSSGTLSTRPILIIDLLSIAVRIGSVVVLLESGLGVFGILLATLMQLMVLGIGLTYILLSKTGIKIDTALFRPVIREGISNFPGKISKMMIAPLSVIMLRVAGISSSELGIFFISLIVTVVAGSFATSLATISLPSSHKNSTISSSSLKFGIAMTTPLVAVLITSPKAILSLIGADYVNGDEILVILSIAILPSVMVFNLITMLNMKNENKKLVIIGLVESEHSHAFLLLQFLITFP